MTDAAAFEPNVIAFCCRHCAYAAADLAGGSRLSYSPALKIVELPCTGRVDVLHVLRTFEDGADGVLVAGCLPGRCHYLTGNLHARQRVDYLGGLLADIGIEAARLRMINVSAAMGSQFAEMASELIDRIVELGPSPVTAGPGKAIPPPTAEAMGPGSAEGFGGNP
jgi:coenzyme F420-reducing hydrogenase delta subunit